MTQRHLFDTDDPDYIASVASGNEAWIETVITMIVGNIPPGEEFTTDRLHFWLDEEGVAPPRDKRAMGAAMRKAVKGSIIEKTGRFVKSTRRVCHGRDIPVWKRK